MYLVISGWRSNALERGHKEEFEVREGKRSRVGKRTPTITPTSIIAHDLIFKE